MPVAPVLILIAAAVVLNLVVMAIIIIPPLFGRPSPLAGVGTPGATLEQRAKEAAVIGGVNDPIDPGAASIAAYDRVIRVVAWTFLLTAFAIVATTGLWPDTQLAIFVLLAFAALFTVLFHELLPPDTLGPAKFVVEGTIAITLATVLVALTGGEDSLFFFTFPVIVAGAAIVLSPRYTLGLAAAAGIGYVLAVLVSAPPGGLTPANAATVGVNLVALILLAYVAMVIALEQRRTRDEAIRLSAVDSLTGLFNRTFFFAAMDREIARCARTGRGFCLLMMDLDELKTINDRLGHFHGDLVLRGVGEVIREGVRKIDTAARYGGDEFVVLLPETDPTGAFVLAEKIRLGVGAIEIEFPEGSTRPSMSIGVVGFPEDGRTSDELIISADSAMYAAKRSGKDRVTAFQIDRAGRRAGRV